MSFLPPGDAGARGVYVVQLLGACPGGIFLKALIFVEVPQMGGRELS